MTEEEKEAKEISKAMSKAAKWGHKKSPRPRKFYQKMQQKRKYTKKLSPRSTKKAS